MPDKIGVYIDESSVKPFFTGEELAEYVSTVLGSETALVKTHGMLNTDEGRQLIQADLDAGEIDSVLVCGTSSRMDWDIFNFGDTVLVERVNLRELCVMCYHNPDGSKPVAGEETPKDMVLMAQDYIKMGVARLSKSAIPQPEDLEATQTILVMGGGFTGLTAARYAAMSGMDVVLIEKSDTLGGKAATMKASFPLAYPYTDKTQEIGIQELIDEVTGNDKIRVMTGVELSELRGAPGTYTAVIGGEEIPVGSVVLATGWVPGRPEFLKPLGYGAVKNVVTTAEFEKMAASGDIKTADGKTPSSVAFIVDTTMLLKDINYDGCGAACAAPEDMPCKDEDGNTAEAPAEAEDGEECETFVYEDKESAKHLVFSSELNCMVALKQANYVREMAPEAVAYVVYDQMMVLGVNENYYKTAQDDPGVMLTKGTVTGVREAGSSILISAKDTLLGAEVELAADMVVVPTAMVPTTAADPVMNFVYRQGPAFPDLELFDGYADSNYICFPYETRRTGVYAAGTVRQPMGLGMAREDACGAVLKAIQCLNSANHSVSVHPRSGDRSFPEFNFTRCTQCKRCTEECPFGALDDDEKGTPLPNPTRCRRCGTCMGACPERVISFSNYGIDQIGSTIKSVKVPDDMVADGPRVIVLACENDAYPALEMAAMRGHGWSPYVRFIPVRCLGSVNAIWVADAMSKGVDGVMMLGCKHGDDYQCHFIKGSELCNRRKENIAESLGRLGVEPERVEQFEVSIDMYDQVPAMIDEFVETITTNFGPNPFKGY